MAVVQEDFIVKIEDLYEDLLQVEVGGGYGVDLNSDLWNAVHIEWCKL